MFKAIFGSRKANATNNNNWLNLKMYDIPNWAGNLTNLYCRLRVSKRNKALRRSYYRKIEKEKLRLAERGINQEKIKAICRYLINDDCVRCVNRKSCRDLIDFCSKPDIQLILHFDKNHHLQPDL